MSDQVRGRLLLRGEDGYEEARVGRIFNARRPDRFPDAILEVADEQDVVAGVRLAVKRGWKVSVRAGGHSWAAWSLHDDALLLDLAALRSIDYDETTGVARFLASKGEGFHHVCLEVVDLAAELTRLGIEGVELIDSAPRRGAEGPVAFIHPRSCHGVLVELIEAPGGPAWRSLGFAGS